MRGLWSPKPLTDWLWAALIHIRNLCYWFEIRITSVLSKQRHTGQEKEADRERVRLIWAIMLTAGFIFCHYYRLSVCLCLCGFTAAVVFSVPCAHAPGELRVLLSVRNSDCHTEARQQLVAPHQCPFSLHLLLDKRGGALLPLARECIL